MSHRASNVLIAAALWTGFIWAFRMWNMIGEDHPVGFLIVHGFIAAVSIAFAVAIFVIARSARRSADARGIPSEGR